MFLAVVYAHAKTVVVNVKRIRPFVQERNSLKNTTGRVGPCRWMGSIRFERLKGHKTTALGNSASHFFKRATVVVTHRSDPITSENAGIVSDVRSTHAIIYLPFVVVFIFQTIVQLHKQQ